MAKPVSCPGRDLNPYKLALTAPSKLRVYQFHHPGEWLTFYPGERRKSGRNPPCLRLRRTSRPGPAGRDGRDPSATSVITS